MTPAAIIRAAQMDGVMLALSSAGTIKATGDGAAVNRWLSVIREHKSGIVEVLQEAAPMTPAEETAIRAWLAHINETDSDIIAEVLSKCRADSSARAYFLWRAADTPDTSCDRGQVSGESPPLLACIPDTCDTPAKTITASEITQPETLLDKQRETRRQKVITLLEETPDSQRAFYTDTDSDPHHVILAIGIRHVATFEMLIDKAKYDPWRLIELIDVTH